MTVTGGSSLVEPLLWRALEESTKFCPRLSLHAERDNSDFSSPTAKAVQLSGSVHPSPVDGEDGIKVIFGAAQTFNQGGSFPVDRGRLLFPEAGSKAELGGKVSEDQEVESKKAHEEIAPMQHPDRDYSSSKAAVAITPVLISSASNIPGERVVTEGLARAQAQTQQIGSSSARCAVDDTSTITASAAPSAAQNPGPAPVGQAFTMFSSGKGRAVSVSAEGLARAQARFSDDNRLHH